MKDCRTNINKGPTKKKTGACQTPATLRQGVFQTPVRRSRPQAGAEREGEGGRIPQTERDPPTQTGEGGGYPHPQKSLMATARVEGHTTNTLLARLEGYPQGYRMRCLKRWIWLRRRRAKMARHQLAKQGRKLGTQTFV